MRFLYGSTMVKKEPDEDQEEPVSPTGQYFNSDVLSIRIMGILELEVPFDTSLALPMLRDVFLPINPRFSSIMVTDENGQKQWRKVYVKLEDHVHIPICQTGWSVKENDEYFANYLSKIGMEQFSQSRPLWEVHVFNYPTSNAGGTIIFKLHHSLGDGYSLMGALLSCLQKADNVNSTLPLTFPRFHRRSSLSTTSEKGEYFLSRVVKNVPRALSSIFTSITDFGSSMLKSSSFVEDDLSPIRSGNVGVEFLPITSSTISFSLDRIKQIKAKLGVTVNDVVCGVIFMGIRMYMQQQHESTKLFESTALVLLNTRDIGGYKSVQEMLDPATRDIWGNKFAFLHVPIPQLHNNTNTSDLNPIDFVMKAHNVIQQKRASFALHLTAWFMEFCRKYRGYEAVARQLHCTMKNSSLCVTHVMGPIEQMSLGNHIVKGLYFNIAGSPQSLLITITSYMGQLRVAIGSERGYIDSASLKLCTENAFELLFKATC